MNNELTSVLEEYNRLGIQQQLDYDKFYLYSIITHSTAIEGSTVTEIENQLLFDEGISTNKPMAEQLMNLDLNAAYEQSFIYAKKYVDYKNSMESDSEEGGQKNKGGQKKWSETTLKILELIKQNPKISRKELCGELGINPSAVQKHIEKLKEANKIERIGGAKGGEWRVSE